MKPVPYYDQDGITIYHGDCAQVLPFLDPVDLLLTDPSYGIGADTHAGKAENGWKQYGSSGWDKEKPPGYLLEFAISKAKIAIVWGGNYFCLPPSMRWLVWDKGQREFSLADCELAWTNQNKAVRAITYSRGEALLDGKQHPTQKPEAVMKWCIGLNDECATILDPFMGSGTTLVAAKNMGKRAIGIERELKYCEIAVRRLAQQTLFQCEQPNIVDMRKS